MMFMRSQLNKLHQQFFHPSTGKPFNLLKSCRPEETSAGTLEVFQDLSKHCDPCQDIHTDLTRFKVSFGIVQFNEPIIMDIVTIDGKNVLLFWMRKRDFALGGFSPTCGLRICASLKGENFQ